MGKIWIPLVFLWCWTSSVIHASGETKTHSKLLVLQPVDLKTGKVSSELGDKIRAVFKSQNRWEVISKKASEIKFGEYNKNFDTPCKELGCAFDAGNILQARYTLYSTVTVFEKYFIFSFNLVDISITKVVWSQNGEIPMKSGDNDEEALLHRLKQLVRQLNTSSLNYQALTSKGTLGILNLSPDTDYSRILFERLATHAHTSGLYDLVGKSELEYILESLNIKLSEVKPTKDVLIPLGQQLGIDFLIYSLLTREKSEFKLNLGLFDIKNQKMERMWPYKSKNFRKLLQFEDTFFSNLTKAERKSQGTEKRKRPRNWKKWIVPALAVAGGALAYMSFHQHSEADKYHDQFQDKFSSANTNPELAHLSNLRNRSESLRRSGYIYSSISGTIFLGGGVILFAF